MRNGKIYIFDNKRDKNNLIALDAENGQIIEQYPSLLENRVNTRFWFNDSSIILWAFKNETPVSMKTETAYLRFSKKGKYSGKASNSYDLPEYLLAKVLNQLKEEDPYPQWWFLGTVGDTLVFENTEVINLKRGKLGFRYTFWLEDSTGRITAKATLDEKTFGEVFTEMPQEHWKLRNRSIYVLTRKGRNALITRIPIDELLRR